MAFNVLISVYDKENLDIIVSSLQKSNWNIWATSGTAKYLEKFGFKINKIENITGFEKLFEGKVKTLHPKIFGGILFDREKHREEAESFGIIPFDMIICNFYPSANEVDIGGPAMVRAAAKNWKWVAVVVDKNDYHWIAQKIEKYGKLDENDRKKLAYKAFLYTTKYDLQILKKFNPSFNFKIFEKSQKLIYGENPHQNAEMFYNQLRWEKLWGRELSLTNILDIEESLDFISQFKDRPVCGIFKHTSICTSAIGENIEDAYLKAIKGDPVSSFGGVVVFNKNLTKEIANLLNERFFDIIVFPDYEDGVLDILKKKKRRRLIKFFAEKVFYVDSMEERMRSGILLRQDKDLEVLKSYDVKVGDGLTDSEKRDIEFGLRVVKHIKSNGVCVVWGGVVWGVGSGGVNRVDMVKIALERAKEKIKQKKAILISDGFFPFPDAVELCAKSGIIKWIVEPGGSKNDDLVIKRAKELGLNLVFTGLRHFRH